MAKHEDNVLGVIAHVLMILTSFIGPLIIYLLADSGKNKDNAKHALNFSFSVIIYWIVVYVLMFVMIGFILAPALWIFTIVVGIIGAVKASKGEVYSYPLEIKFIK